MQHSEVRNYGFNIIMKNYTRFPYILPMPCHMEHGWTPLEGALISDLKTDKPLMMVFSKRRRDAWKKKSRIPVVIMGSPFIHYKNTHKIAKKKDAKGTVAFPNHSTYDLKSQFSIKEYCRELKKLPKKFQPITICLFWLDFIDQKADIYRKMGFPVVSAGPKFTNSLNFVNNFYNILSNHKYATSNEIGSYTFYAVDLGLPFFLTGKAPILLNKGCKDLNVGESTRLDDFVWGKRAIKLFSTGPTQKISAGQGQFVIEEMGINDCLSPAEMRSLFWKYFNRHHYWLRAFIPYILTSILFTIIFNGPWIVFLISIRNLISKHQ